MTTRTLIATDQRSKPFGKSLVRVKYGPSKWAASTYDGGLLWITAKSGLLMVRRSQEGYLAALGELVCVVDLGLQQIQTLSTEDMLRLTSPAIDWENLDETFSWNITDSMEEIEDSQILGKTFFDREEG